MKRPILVAALLILALALWGETMHVAEQPFGVSVISSDTDHTVLQLRMGEFERTPVQINGNQYYTLKLSQESETYTVGEPELPKATRSLQIGDDALVQVRVVSEQHVDLTMPAAPSKGAISRAVDPETVPYTFSDVYRTDAFYPGVAARLNHPYILRDIRGIALDLYPFQYNPVTNTLRVYTDLTVEVYRAGTDTENVKIRHDQQIDRGYLEVYRNHFLNWGVTRYDPIGEQGSMLVISHPNFISAMQPFVDWKNQKGIPCEMIDVSTVGTTAAQIKTFIQNRYDEGGLTYVLLVGDAPQIPSFSSGGGASDPTYSLLEGNDYYPDLFVGRFSAENVAQAQTQIQRTLTYERDTDSGDWEHKGTGIASSQGAGQGDDGESDYAHIGNIRTDLLGYTYTEVDEIYETNGASAQDVYDALNDGRSVISYCGHGSDTSWSTTGFSVANINSTNLTNDNMLPFIFSVACVNGNFASQTCFAEAWMRAVNAATSQPKGAIGCYMSSINQDWASPMSGEDEMIDLLVAQEKVTFGGLCYNGSCLMLDEYGSNSGSSGCNMFLTWHVFGDPSLLVRTDTPQDVAVSHIPVLFMGMTTFDVQTDQPNALVCLSLDGQILSSGYANDSGDMTLQLTDMPTEPATLTLTVSGPNTVAHVESVSYMPADGPYLLLNSLRTDSGSNLVYAQTMDLGVDLSNLGVATATNVTATLACSNPYITVVDGTEVLGDINASTTPAFEDIFSVQVSPNTPDQTQINFTITLQDGAGHTWDASPVMAVDAPSLCMGSITIDDATGDNDGVFEPGETVAYTLPVRNLGHAASPAGLTRLVCHDSRLTIAEESVDISEINPDSENGVAYHITCAGDVQNGSLIPAGLALIADPMIFQTLVNITVGSISEDFEGDINGLPWNLYPAGSNSNWNLSATAPYDGQYCLQSGTVNNSQQSGISVDVTVVSPGNLTFAYKVSSENGYDYLKFYIDNVQQGIWSGEVPWTVATYPVTAGAHNFIWKFMRDYAGSAGSNCAWIDDVQFPFVGGEASPLIATSASELNFGDVEVGSTATRTLVLFNMGSVELTGGIHTPDGYTILNPARLSTRKSVRENSRADYTFSLSPGEYYEYTVQLAPTTEIDYTGAITIDSNDPLQSQLTVTVFGHPSSGQTDNNVPGLVNAFRGAYPNPFNPETSLNYSLAHEGRANLAVYNVKGQLVRTLVNENKAAGQYTVKWNGTDNNGRNVASGVYFGIFTTKADSGDRYTSTKKMILLK
jgi:hypothetical protein